MKTSHLHRIAGHLDSIQDILDEYPGQLGPLDLALGAAYDALETLSYGGDVQRSRDVPVGYYAAHRQRHDRNRSLPGPEGKTAADGDLWMTLEDFYNSKGVWRSLSYLSRVGKGLTSKLTAMGLEPLEVYHEKWATVNSYPAWLLEWHFQKEMKA